jgi:hypothetical protein
MFDKPHHPIQIRMKTKYNSNCHTTKTCLTNRDICYDLSLALDVVSGLNGKEARTMLRHMLLNVDQSLFWMAHSELPRFSASHHTPPPAKSATYSQTEDTTPKRIGQSHATARQASKSPGQHRSVRRH